MNLKQTQRSAATALLIILLSLVASSRGSAQESQDSTTIAWWVIGTGGALATANEDGDTLSATLGQTAVDSTTVDDSTFGKLGTDIPRTAMTTWLGFWLPRQAASVESLPAIAATANALAVANAPNPFRESTTISYQLPVGGDVRLEIFDDAGSRVRLLVDERQAAGGQSVIWDGSNDGGVKLASGIYFYRLEARGGVVRRAYGTISIAR
jgi:hypothetical protein